jgi:hypothetical protein
LVACFRGLEARGEKGEPWTEVLSWEPRAFVYHNFLVSTFIVVKEHLIGARMRIFVPCLWPGDLVVLVLF